MPIKHPNCKASAIIVAAGNSTRMGKGINKQFLMLDGVPLLAYALLSFDKAQTIDDIIIVTKPENIITVSDMVREFGISKVKAIVPGGSTRAESVMCGLNEVENSRLVAVHDGARPFVTPQKIDELTALAHQYGSAAPGVMPKDTIKIVGNDNYAAETPERSSLKMIQTPQVFKADELKLAYIRGKESGFEGTDDCSYMENMGMSVYIAESDYTNIKVTTPEDIAIAESILQYINNKR